MVSAARIARSATAGDRVAGLLFIAFALLVQLLFALLGARFDYPDVLRRPAGAVLAAFGTGGRELPLIWYAYAMSICVFAAGVLSFDRGDTARRTATWLAMASALVQWIALSRWTFAVPLLAQAHAVAPDAAARFVIEQLFAAQHSLLGIGLGEHLGQLLMAGWTIAMSRLLPAMHRRWVACAWIAAALFTVGLSEQVGTAVGLDVGWGRHAALLAFVLWSVWLLAVGLHLARGRGEGEHHLRAEPAPT